MEIKKTTEQKGQFTSELDGIFSIIPSLLVSNRNNPEKGRKKSGDTENQNKGTFKAEEFVKPHRTSLAEEGSRSNTAVRLLHNWQLLIFGLPHFHHSIGFQHSSFTISDFSRYEL